MSGHKRFLHVLTTIIILTAVNTKGVWAQTTPSQQEQQADSLRAQFKRYYAANQVSQAYATLDELIQLEQKSKNVEREAAARWNKIALLNNAARYDSLLHETDIEMTWFKEHDMWERFYQTWQRKCSANHDMGRMQSALREARAMQDDAQRRNNNTGRAMAYKQMGVVYYDIRQLEPATKAFEHSVRLLTEEKDSTGMLSGVYEGLCQTLDRRGMYQEELTYSEAWAKHLTILVGKHGMSNVSPTFVSCYLAHTAAYIGLKKFNEARTSLQEAERYQKIAESVLSLYYVYEAHCRLALAEGKYAEAIAYSDSTLRLGVQVDENINELRAEALMQAGRGIEAAEIYRSLYTRKDTTYTRDMRTQLDELNTLFQLDEMEREQQATRIRTIFIFGALIIGGLLVFLVYRRIEDKKLKRLNEQLRTASEQAQESSRMKSAFIKNISHEIRTPLNVLSGFTQIITSPEMDIDEEELHDVRFRIRENTERITGLVNKMLELSDANSQTVIECEDKVNPIETAAQAAIDAHMDEYRKIKFNIDITPKAKNHTLLTNRKQLTRALKLLLDNAIKFTKEGRVNVHIDTTNDERSICFAVEDTGIGIPASESERIFEEFVQLDEYIDGTGIGLTVARSIARRMGGDIVLDTSYQGGARFLLTLPFTS